MSGKPLFDRAMTGGERQRRWRAKLKRQQALERGQPDPLSPLIAMWNRLDAAEQDRFLDIIYGRIQ